jgi:hypothetical protein
MNGSFINPLAWLQSIPTVLRLFYLSVYLSRRARTMNPSSLVSDSTQSGSVPGPIEAATSSLV